MLHRIIVNGAQGKMGLLACKALEQHPDFDLVGRFGRNDSLQAAIIKTKAQIVVDLTSAASVYENAQTIIQQGAHPVIGTSGLLDEQLEALRQYCEAHQLGGIVVPNFSIAAVLMMRFAAEAARFLPDVEILEAHHPDKLDAPSGTSLKTAQLIANARSIPPRALSLREVLPGARGARAYDVPIHSMRLPGILAHQRVVFGNSGETLSLTHDTIDRSSFMPGLILACLHVSHLSSLQYGLETLLALDKSRP